MGSSFLNTTFQFLPYVKLVLGIIVLTLSLTHTSLPQRDGSLYCLLWVTGYNVSESISSCFFVIWTAAVCIAGSFYEIAMSFFTDTSPVLHEYSYKTITFTIITLFSFASLITVMGGVIQNCAFLNGESSLDGKTCYDAMRLAWGVSLTAQGFTILFSIFLVILWAISVYLSHTGLDQNARAPVIEHRSFDVLSRVTKNTFDGDDEIKQRHGSLSFATVGTRSGNSGSSLDLPAKLSRIHTIVG